MTLEFPDITFQRITLIDDDDDDDDLEEKKDSETKYSKSINLNKILTIAEEYSNEIDILYDKQDCMIRIRRAIPLSVSNENRRVLHGDGLYILTGGTGGIGSALVQWLVDVQHINPSNIILLTRRSGPHHHPLGCHLLTLDVSQSKQWTKEQLVELKNITTCKNDKRKKRKKRVIGIFHLAGTLDDGMVNNMTRSRIKTVIGPKVLGLLRLLKLSKRWKWKTKYVLNFSSTTSLLGYPGQSNYAAANSMLDGFASFCDLSTTELLNNVPIITCNWGPWGEVGMAKVGSKPYNSGM